MVTPPSSPRQPVTTIIEDDRSNPHTGHLDRTHSGTEATTGNNSDNNNDLHDSDLSLTPNCNSGSTDGGIPSSVTSGVSLMTGPYLPTPLSVLHTHNSAEMNDFARTKSTSSEFLFTPISEDNPPSVSSAFDSIMGGSVSEVRDDDDDVFHSTEDVEGVPMVSVERFRVSQYLAPSSSTGIIRSGPQDRIPPPTTSSSSSSSSSSSDPLPRPYPLKKQRSSPVAESRKRRLRLQRENLPPRPGSSHQHASSPTINVDGGGESDDSQGPPLVVTTTITGAFPTRTTFCASPTPTVPHPDRPQRLSSTSRARSSGRPPRDPCAFTPSSHRSPAPWSGGPTGIRTPTFLTPPSPLDNNGGGTVLLSDPIRLTRSSSTPTGNREYNLRYDDKKKGRKSPWGRLVDMTSSAAASFLSGGSSRPGGGFRGSSRASSSGLGSLELRAANHISESESNRSGGGSLGTFDEEERDSVAGRGSGGGGKGRCRSDSIFRGSTPTTHNRNCNVRRGRSGSGSGSGGKVVGDHFFDEVDDVSQQQQLQHRRSVDDDRDIDMQLSTSFPSKMDATHGDDHKDGSRFIGLVPPSSAFVEEPTTLHLHDSLRDILPKVSSDYTRNTFFTFFTFAQIKDKSSFMHLCIFAVFGSTLRITLARIFGHDCEFPQAVNDFISHLSTCVTASGTTAQRGGALFIDLPANILGSFFLGILTPVNQDVPPIPWLRPDHGLQVDAGMHFGIRVAFCGSLTTFASWNTQMVVMMVGRGTVVGRQIIPSLFGYGMGLICTISSFLMGRQAAEFLYDSCNADGKKSVKGFEKVGVVGVTTKVNNGCTGGGGISKDGNDGHDTENPGVEVADNKIPRSIVLHKARGTCTKFLTQFYRKYFFCVIAIGLFSLLVVGDFIYGIRFYRQVWVSSLFALPGSLLRWNLSFWNGQLFHSRERLSWVPWGTLTANVLGCIVSVVAQALIFRLDEEEKEDGMKRLMLMALKTGLAGNISTVSTFVKEVVHLYEKFHHTRRAYIYAIGSIVLCWLPSFCIYLPIVHTV